jgi:hypothetical protein
MHSLSQRRILSILELQGVAPLFLAQRILIMKLLSNLLTTDYGLLSIAVIVFVLGMTVWFARYFKRHMDEDARNAGE